MHNGSEEEQSYVDYIKEVLSDSPNPVAELYLWFPGRPHAWQAPRLFKGRIIPNKDNEKAQGELVKYLRKTYQEAELIWEGGVSLHCLFIYPKPKKWYKGKLKTRPDIDNLLYTPMNAFKGVIWHDDEAVQWIHGGKMYSGKGVMGSLYRVCLYEPVYG